MHEDFFRSEIDQAKTVKEIFLIVEKYYEISKPLTTVQRLTIIAGIKAAIQIIKPQENKI